MSRAHHELVITAVLDELKRIALEREIRTAAATLSVKLTRNVLIESDREISRGVNEYADGWWDGWLGVTLATEMVSHCEREFVLNRLLQNSG